MTRYKIDKRNRKAYIANNQGDILVINCENAVKLKSVTSEDEKVEPEKEKEEEESYPSVGSSDYS